MPGASGCPPGDGSAPLSDQVSCILLYGGDAPLDVALNYSLVLLNVSVAAACVLRPRARASRRRRRNSPAGGAACSRVPLPELGALGFVVAFQVGLCLAVGCAGVSIVWCAVCGWTVRESRAQSAAAMRRRSAGGEEERGRDREEVQETEEEDTGQRDRLLEREEAEETQEEAMGGREKFAVKALWCVDGVAVAYYAAVAEPITTVAHGLAIGMGMGLSWLLDCFHNRGSINEDS